MRDEDAIVERSMAGGMPVGKTDTPGGATALFQSLAGYTTGMQSCSDAILRCCCLAHQYLNHEIQDIDLLFPEQDESCIELSHV